EPPVLIDHGHRSTSLLCSRLVFRAGKEIGKLSPLGTVKSNSKTTTSSTASNVAQAVGPLSPACIQLPAALLFHSACLQHAVELDNRSSISSHFKESNMHRWRAVATLICILGLQGLATQFAYSQANAAANTAQVHIVITDAALRAE